MHIFFFYISALFFFAACVSGGCSTEGPGADGPPGGDYRQAMRTFVQTIQSRAQIDNPAFIIIPQNGQELLTLDGTAQGPPASGYIQAIDGVGREDLLYGYTQDNMPTPERERSYMEGFLDRALQNSIEVLVTDYCSAPSFVDASYEYHFQRGWLSFAADSRELDRIPAYPQKAFNENTESVSVLSDAQNFLYLLNPSSYSSKNQYLEALQETGYDLIIIDAFFEETLLKPEEVARLKEKPGGGSRMAIAYMSIGEAEDYRYYWSSQWNEHPPAWIAGENPDWPGNYKVRYWDDGWQDIICGYGDSYLTKITGAGFDGVYLDIIDAYEYFESSSLLPQQGGELL